jgi:hypothetical protein
MSTAHLPITVTVAEGAVAGVRLWRQCGQLYATVALKATFTLSEGTVIDVST